MRKKAYSPYAINTQRIDRFRGIAGLDGMQNFPKEYVSDSDNVESFKIGELRARVGQTLDALEPTGAVHSGDHLISMFTISTGPDVFVEDLASRLLRTTGIDFINPIPPSGIGPIRSGITCADLWEEYPGFSAYERSENEFVDPFDGYDSITSTCWDTGGPNLPHPPLPPTLPPSRPIDGGGIADGGEVWSPPIPTPPTTRPQCGVNSINIDKAVLSVETQIGQTPGTDTLTITATGRFTGGITSAVIQNYDPAFTVSRNSNNTRDFNGYITSMSTTITIEPTDDASELGVIEKTLVITFNICGDEHYFLIPVNHCVYSGTPFLRLLILMKPGDGVPAYWYTQSGDGCYAPGGGDVALDFNIGNSIKGTKYYFVARANNLLVHGRNQICADNSTAEYFSIDRAFTIENIDGEREWSPDRVVLGSKSGTFCVGFGCGANIYSGVWGGSNGVNVWMYKIA